MARTTTSVSLSAEGRRQLDALSAHLDLGKSEVMQLALERLAQHVRPGARPMSSFRELVYGPAMIRVMESNEGGLPELMLVSIKAPGLPTVRITRDGLTPLRPEDEPYPVEGLVIFGNHKEDRPALR